MQRVETNTLLDSISPKAAVGKGLLQGDVGGTTKRFNQLLNAVQNAATKGNGTTDVTGAEGATDTNAAQLLPGTAQIPGEGAPLSTEGQITPATPSALTTLVAIAENAATSQPTADGSEAVIAQTVIGALPSNTSAPEIATASAASVTNLVSNQRVPSQQPTAVKVTEASGVVPATAPNSAASAAQPNVSLTQSATAVATDVEQPTVRGVAVSKDTPSNPTQTAPAKADVTAPNISAVASKQDVTVSTQQPQQVVNTSSAEAGRLQVANLAPQAQPTTPQAAATLGAAAPIVGPQPDGQRPQTAINKTPAGVIQTGAAPDAVDQAVPSIRPGQPVEGQQNTVPGALNAAVDAEIETPAAPKSVWQAAQNAQPNFLTKPDTQVLATAPDAAVVNDLPETFTRTPAEALQPVSTASKDLTTVSPAQAAASKTPVSKPFSEALMMQVKAAEVVDGRTSVHLHPRGLGNIDVEIIAGEKDLASKVIVRVENPMILQHLRDDRHLLAQTIGVSDNTVFEFHERGAEQQGSQSQGGQSDFADTSLEGADVAAPVQHADIVADDRIDILT